MSWSVSMIGKPENVAAALKDESAKLSGQSQVEYNDALPALVALVEQNFGKRDPYVAPLVKLSASGSGTAVNGEQVSRSCSVTIEPMWTRLV